MAAPADPRRWTRETGQGDAHVQYAFAAHRAVVDVDVELGLVRVVELATAQDVGRALQPAVRSSARSTAARAQGLGLAVMEEIQVVDGLVRNPSFTDYLIPTILDMPPMRVDVLELGRPARAVRSARGRGAADDLLDAGRSSPRSAPPPGCALDRVPVRPEHLTGT